MEKTAAGQGAQLRQTAADRQIRGDSRQISREDAGASSLLFHPLQFCRQARIFLCGPGGDFGSRGTER